VNGRNRIVRVATLALAAGALLTGAVRHHTGGGAGTSQGKAAAPQAQNWNASVRRTDHDSYVLGNPAAKIKLVAFISYTCPHCAAFETEAESPLRLRFIASGQGSLEVRSFLRDPVDMTVALLTHCGPTDKFFLNHAAFLGSQASWIAPAARPSPLQQRRWFTGALATRLRYIAADFHFYDIMETRGFSHAEVDKCLADLTLAKRLAADTDLAQKDYAIQGTPSFLINNALLTGTFSWDILRPQLEARMD
jgi:protein-disulfide isomerase